MIDVRVTQEQFFYLQAAVKRDLEMLEEMAPWDIDDQKEEHAAEVRLNKAVSRLLHVIEQQQVITH